MTREIFFNWFVRFIDSVKPTKEKPVLLILDGHMTHTQNLEVVEYARENHVIILCLPPHTTLQLQPLDVSVMRPVSMAYSEEAKKWLREHPGRVITANDITHIYNASFKSAAKPETIENGFKKAGIWPSNRSVYSDDDFVAVGAMNPKNSSSVSTTTTITTTTTEDDDDEDNNSFYLSSNDDSENDEDINDANVDNNDINIGGDDDDDVDGPEL
ncbi:uncharacterized protein LOC103570382 [Microplitis demolitor]|uniref:uncharacterized protein LOC103570382 n=1 Tax=Microplitis demolitor TaxID=69319 RepID=UPI0004CD56CB|nr:uncharacterized protein LOC103570382 [Microplitis demolitor]